MSAIATASDPIDFTIDPELASLCPSYVGDEGMRLHASLVEHGVREPFVVWKEQRILLDGHRRFATCRTLGIPFPTVEYSFADRDAAKTWVIDNQLGRRNLTREQRDYLRGLRYAAQKREPTETLRRGEASPPGQSGQTGPTAARVAAAAGVSEKTVRRAAAFAKAVDEIARDDPDAKAEILAGKTKLTRAAVTNAVKKRVSLRKLMKSVSASAAARARPKESHVSRIDTLGLQLAKAINKYKMAGFLVEELRAVDGLGHARRMLAEIGEDAAAPSGGEHP